MGDALVVMTIPEEALMLERLFDSDGEGGEALLVDLHAAEWPRLRFSRAGRADLLRQHPNAYYRLPVRHTDIWDPPAEPGHEQGPDWHRDPALRRAHREAMRRSLDDFLNRRLKRLYRMLRTGWWVLGEVRVRVTVCKPVPEREMRTGVLRPTKRKKPTTGP